MTDDRLRLLHGEPELTAALAEPVAVLFKHSPRCWVSASAMHQVLAFVERHPDVPVYVVDVVEQRHLSRSLAGRLRVRHESPQAMVLRQGAVLWHNSHGGVTADALVREVLEVGGPA